MNRESFSEGYVVTCRYSNIIASFHIYFKNMTGRRQLQHKQDTIFKNKILIHQATNCYDHIKQLQTYA